METQLIRTLKVFGPQVFFWSHHQVFWSRQTQCCCGTPSVPFNGCPIYCLMNRSTVDLNSKLVERFGCHHWNRNCRGGSAFSEALGAGVFNMSLLAERLFTGAFYEFVRIFPGLNTLGTSTECIFCALFIFVWLQHSWCHMWSRISEDSQDKICTTKNIFDLGDVCSQGWMLNKKNQMGCVTNLCNFFP